MEFPSLRASRRVGRLSGFLALALPDLALAQGGGAGNRAEFKAESIAVIVVLVIGALLLASWPRK